MFNLIIFVLAVWTGHPTRWYGPSAAVVGTFYTSEQCEKARKEFKPNFSGLGLGPDSDEVSEIRVVGYCSSTDRP